MPRFLALGAATLFGATVLSLSATPARADHSLSAGARVCYFVSGNTQCYSSSGVPGGGTVSGWTPGTGTGVGNGLYDGAQFAGAYQDYGVFRGNALASYTMNGYDPVGGGVSSTATGTMTDTLTLHGGTGLAYLRLSWTITGGTSATAHSVPGEDVDAYLISEVFTTAGSGAWGGAVTGSGSTGFVRTGGTYRMIDTDGHIGLPFYFDQPLSLSIISTVFAGASYTGGALQPATFSGVASAGFEHTAILSGIEAVDAGGHVIDGITISAESGTRYPVLAVPEPSSWALMAGGIGLLAALARRRRASVS